MRIITLLNQKHHLKSFVYKKDSLEEIKGNESYVVEIEPRKNSHPICSRCGQLGSIYDHQKVPRLFEFVPIWGIKVYFRYAMRRVDCKTCKVRIEKVPWVEGKSHLTKV